MLYQGLVAGTFLKRDNRFLATVRVAGRECAAHVASSGRMQELLVEGASVWLRPQNSPGRKTRYDLALVESAGVLVSVDARLPNRLYREAWGCGTVLGAGSGTLQQEVRWGASRLDFCINAGGAQRWIEVKSVTLVRDRMALFPDAPTARGAKHLAALIDIAQHDHESAVVFVVQRPDADRFAPHWAADPQFGKALLAASRSGVVVEAYACAVSTERSAITHPLLIALEP